MYMNMYNSYQFCVLLHENTKTFNENARERENKKKRLKNKIIENQFKRTCVRMRYQALKKAIDRTTTTTTKIETYISINKFNI